MPLGDDQKAMLRLLAGGQSYEDIAALMGLSVDEVATRAKGAVTQLEAEGIPAPTLPAAPEGSAPKPAAPPPKPTEPKAEKAPAPTPAPTQEPPAKKTSPSPGSAAKPGDTNKLLAIGAGVAAIVIVVLLVLLLTGGDDDKGDPTTAAGGDGTSAEVSNGEEPAPTLAELKAVDGESGSGTALFGNLNESLVLAIEAKGLEPTAKGTRYAICIANGPDKILPIASTAVGANGVIKASVELPDELLLYLVNETYSEIVVTRADTARLAAEIKRQPKQPQYTGTRVLQGEITGDLIGNEELLAEVEKAREAEEAAAKEAEAGK